MIDGLWTVEFRSTISRFGSGVLLIINNNRLLGGDDGYYYSGTCKVTENKIRATIDVTRYNKDSVSVFGDYDHYELTLDGVIDEYQFAVKGTFTNKPQFQISVVGKKREDL
ncbi:MAG TPA: hypothetical protein DCY12_09205 [Candidatus Atribacteria bacterium]|nr:hypothetical protein [Candidatus Atribacteria bacterium]